MTHHKFKALGWKCRWFEKVQPTRQPRSLGSTGVLKGRASGSCLYSFSKVGTSIRRSSSGKNTEIKITRVKECFTR